MCHLFRLKRMFIPYMFLQKPVEKHTSNVFLYANQRYFNLSVCSFLSVHFNWIASWCRKLNWSFYSSCCIYYLLSTYATLVHFTYIEILTFLDGLDNYYVVISIRSLSWVESRRESAESDPILFKVSLLYSSLFVIFISNPLILLHTYLGFLPASCTWGMDPDAYYVGWE